MSALQVVNMLTVMLRARVAKVRDRASREAGSILLTVIEIVAIAAAVATVIAILAGKPTGRGPLPPSG